MSRNCTSLGHATDGVVQNATYELGNKDRDMKKLAGKLADVMGVIRAPNKSGRNTYEKYDYATRDDVFEVVRGELAKRGVAYLSSSRIVDFSEAPPTGKGVKQFRTHVEVTIELIDSESGETLSLVWPGESVTNTDRGVQMANTQAVRFALLNLFMLADGEDMGQPNQGGVGAPATTREEPAPPSQEERADEFGEVVNALGGYLASLGVEGATVKAFINHAIPALERANGIQATSVRDLPPARIRKWVDTLKKISDPEEVKSKVTALVAEHTPAAA